MQRLRSVEHLLTHPTPAHLILLVGGAAVVGAMVFLLLRLSVAALFALTVMSEVFAGNWKYMHVPLPLDRVLLVISIGALLWKGSGEVVRRKLVLSPAHLLLAAVSLYVTLNALWAGTLGTSVGLYALLDRLGLVPFLMFILAPIVFGSARGRNTLLAGLVVVGAYLGFTAVMEGLGVHALVQPGYILDPNLGIHFGRARGPMLESVSDGLSMFMCGVAAAVALSQWRSAWARRLCWFTIGSSIAGGIFTLTRTVWLGDVVGALIPMVYDKRLRRYVPRILLGSAVAVVALILFVPGLHQKLGSRTTEASPVWDRYNVNDAALRAWVAHPLSGIGWEKFVSEGPDYLRQAGSYPMTGAGLEVHNVFLSHLTELGLPGAILWSVALFGIVGGAIVRRGPPELYPWRLGLMAVFAFYLLAANLGPMSYPFPNLLLWLWPGVIAAGRYSAVRAESPDPDPSPALTLPVTPTPPAERILLSRR